MRTKWYSCILIPFCPAIFVLTLNGASGNSKVKSSNACIRDSAHYWRLKAHLDPHAEAVRINPENYEDNGLVAPPDENDPCSKGYDELCGIYVAPNPENKNQPAFSKIVNSDIYQALKKNEYLEGKVFLKDL